jgi:glycine/D-amino acid oxidase-like deaminating enzyme
MILQSLKRILRDLILPGYEFEIEQSWSGIMGFSADKYPIIKKVSAHLTIGFACNGMGVSLAGVIGEELSELILS